jgi:hypothetical protein
MLGLTTLKQSHRLRGNGDKEGGVVKQIDSGFENRNQGNPEPSSKR